MPLLPVSSALPGFNGNINNLSSVSSIRRTLNQEDNSFSPDRLATQRTTRWQLAVDKRLRRVELARVLYHLEEPYRCRLRGTRRFRFHQHHHSLDRPKFL